MQSLKVLADASTSAASSFMKNVTGDARVAAVAARSGEVLATAAQGSSEYASEHPMAAAALLMGLAIVAAPALVVTPALAAAGFTANGVAAGSAAAAAHAGIGNVVAGSGFAIAQSAAAGGYGLAVVNGGVQAAAGLTAVGGLITGRSKKE